MRRALAVLAAVMVAVPLAATPSPGQAPPRTRLLLVSQSAVVGTGGEFVLRLRVDRTNLPSNAEILLTVYPSVQTRSEFEQTAGDRFGRQPLGPWPAIPVSSLQADAAGEVTVRLPVRDPGQPADPGRFDLRGDNGVYPVRVELRERGGVSLDRFVTHLVYFPTAPAGPKLGLAMVLPLHAATGLPADGPREVENLDEVAAAAQALEATRLPFAVVPSPETVATLAATNEDRATRALDALRRVAVDKPVVGAPYVPVSLPALLGAGMREEVTSQLDQGVAVVGNVLRVQPDTRTWMAVEPLNPDAVDELVARGVSRVVAVEGVLEPIAGQNLTLTRPFSLGGDEEEVAAVAADGGLGAYFNADPNQVLQAHRLLADLAVLWLDAPGDDRRAVVAAPPREWKANRAFLDALTAGLAQSPVAEPVSLDTVFGSVDPAVTARGAPLLRDPAPVPREAASLGDIVPDVRQLRRRLTSLGSVLGAEAPASLLLEERLLVAESSELRTARQRLDYLNSVETGIADQLDAIDMPEGRSITLTARRGQIPVTFQNRTGSPVQVVVTVDSDKLEFPEGESRPMELDRRNTTERFSVVARTSGAFPLSVTLMSPDGNLVIGRARLTVRSTAASGASLFVSAGAALFLAVWWAKHAARGRRARRLVPS